MQKNITLEELEKERVFIMRIFLKDVYSINSTHVKCLIIHGLCIQSKVNLRKLKRANKTSDNETVHIFDRMSLTQYTP